MQKSVSENPVSEASPDLDRRLVLATQAGLPLHAQPYHWLASELGVEPELVMRRIHAMLDDGRIRRIGVLPNHYRLGYVANGMSVWDVPDEVIAHVGEQIGRLHSVSHCYQRPRHLPDWPYKPWCMDMTARKSWMKSRSLPTCWVTGHAAMISCSAPVF